MSLNTTTFEPDNIVRYIWVTKQSGGKFGISIDWHLISKLLEQSNIPINIPAFEAVCKKEIDTNITNMWGVPKDKPEKAKILPWMAALLIYECARQMLEIDSNPDTAGDIGDSTTPEDFRVESDSIHAGDKGEIEVLEEVPNAVQSNQDEAAN